ALCGPGANHGSRRGIAYSDARGAGAQSASAVLGGVRVVRCALIVRLARALIAAATLAAAPALAASASDALDRLVAPYPAATARHEGPRLYWKDGTAMAVPALDDTKPFDDLLRHASILG